MTQYARLYGGSLYDLAAEENLTDAIGEQMKEIRVIFRENPDYVKAAFASPQFRRRNGPSSLRTLLADRQSVIW